MKVIVLGTNRRGAVVRVGNGHGTSFTGGRSACVPSYGAFDMVGAWRNKTGRDTEGHQI